jgi:hypothetical protein
VDVEVDELDCHGPELARPPRMGGQNVRARPEPREFV